MQTDVQPIKLKVLLVDDDKDLLEALTALLRRRFQIFTAVGGEAGLRCLADNPEIPVIVSDLRMPGMDGATFLARACEVAPDAVRVLLTGYSELEGAIAAVNEGHIFRFLSKPCPPAHLVAAIEAAAAQHRLITAEHVLLEQTLHGAIRTLTDVLAMTNPVSFGRATRIKPLVAALARELGLKGLWQLEVAALLSQIGYLTLPPDTAEKVYAGAELTVAEEDMLERVPAVTQQLLANIPRMEMVCSILAHTSQPYQTTAPRGEPMEVAVARRGAHLLRVALDYDTLDSRGLSPDAIVAQLRAGSSRYAPDVLDALEVIVGGVAQMVQRIEVKVGGLQVGMVLAEDVRLAGGLLFIARGHEVTDGMLERLRNLRPGSVREPLSVLARRSPPIG